MSASTESSTPKSGRASASTTSGGTAITRSGPSATAAGRVGAHPQAPGGTMSASASASPASPGNGSLRRTDQLDDPRIDVAADHLVTSQRDLGGDRQADLAEGDDDRAHQDSLGRLTVATVSPVRALWRTASAARTTSTPLSSVTTPGSRRPAIRSRNASCSSRSGSSRASA